MNLQRRDIALAATAALLGVAASANHPARAQSADERAVAQAVEALAKAMLAVDRAGLEAAAADQLSYGHSAGKIETKKEFVDAILSREAAFRKLDLSDQTISVAENEAIVRHLMTGETVSPSGQVSPVKVGVLQVWQKQGGNWKLLARQAYRL
jgi:ketosteroid isomerase-like protein